MYGRTCRVVHLLPGRVPKVRVAVLRAMRPISDCGNTARSRLFNTYRRARRDDAIALGPRARTTSVVDKLLSTDRVEDAREKGDEFRFSFHAQKPNEIFVFTDGDELSGSDQFQRKTMTWPEVLVEGDIYPGKITVLLTSDFFFTDSTHTDCSVNDCNI